MGFSFMYWRIHYTWSETNTKVEDAEKVQKVQADKIERCVKKGENCVKVGDTNAAVNQNVNIKTPAAKKMQEWEASKNVINLNDKDQPNRVPDKKGEQANCLDLSIATPELSNQ